MDAPIHDGASYNSVWHSIHKLRTSVFVSACNLIFPNKSIILLWLLCRDSYNLKSYRHIRLKFGQSIHLACRLQLLIKLEFKKCAIVLGFCRSGHIQPVYNSSLVQTQIDSVNMNRIKPNCVKPLWNGSTRDVGLVWSSLLQPPCVNSCEPADQFGPKIRNIDMENCSELTPQNWEIVANTCNFITWR